MEEDAQRIVRKNNRRFVQSIRNHDFDAIEELYADDSVLMPPNNVMVRGNRGSKEYWSAAIKMGLREAELLTIEAQRFGDEIQEIGSYRLMIAPEHKKAHEDVGKYMTVWKLQTDGTWRLQRDIWNSDLPKKNSK